MEQSNDTNHRIHRNPSRVEDLHLDRVVASQPEIGPTPPDGGYGWVIVVSAIIYNITVPPLLFLYGFIILKSIREEDHDEGEKMKIWDVDVALVPVIMIVMKLLLESWCRAGVKMFNMPRFTALAGLCMTVAGVLLSSYSTSVYSNDHIINIFAGMLAGSGYALTGQQTDIIITHYFRDKLTIVQRLVRMAPTLGNVLMPIIIGHLCTVFTSDIVVMMYGAIVMQNCLFLAAYTRPVYIERVIRSTYNMIRAVEDDDEIIFSNQNPRVQERNDNERTTQAVPAVNVVSLDEDSLDVVVFKSQQGAKEIIDPEVRYRQTQGRFSSDFSAMQGSSNRFSSDFGAMFDSQSHRFSTDFGTLDIGNRVSGYQELESIDRDNQNPQPLYRETTVDAPSSLVFPTEMSPGTARRTASMKKNFITITNMLLDVNFYLYTLLHLCTTFSALILGVIFPPMVWELNPSMNIWSVATMTAIAHAFALCFILVCVALPRNINETSRLYAVFCLVGAVGFYGITMSKHKSFLVLWCTLASLSTAASGVLQQPLYNALNDFDTTATMTSANTIVAVFIMIWSISYSYEYKTLFFVATLLQMGAASIFLATSFRRRR